MRCIKNNTINCVNFNTLHDGKYPEVNKITVIHRRQNLAQFLFPILQFPLLRCIFCL
jgi:hypothetical protein